MALFLLYLCTVSIGLLIPTVWQQGGTIYYVKPGENAKTLIHDLASKHMIRFSSAFYLYVYFYPKVQLKTGEYVFKQWSTPYSIWQQVIHGYGLFYRAFTIVPGWSFKDLRRALLQTSSFRHFLQQWDDQQLMANLGYPNVSPEGQFFPETYYYAKDSLDLVILKRAIDLMHQRLNEAWEQRAPNLPFKNAYDVLIAASLVEKEAYFSFERPWIAGVLINRLNKNMLLQFDPTVIYGMGDLYKNKITKEDLRRDTAFNTYLHKGLPPTPIAMPSMASIEAVLHPTQHDYYYFVAVGDGRHQFSKSLNEHALAVTAYKNQKRDYFNMSLIRCYVEHLLPYSIQRQKHCTYLNKKQWLS